MNDTTQTMNKPPPEALPTATATDSTEATSASPHVPLLLASIDVEWPDENNRGFVLELPQPALFQRVVRAEVPSPILGGRRKIMMRTVWMVRVDGPVARSSFLAQLDDEIMAMPADGGGPKLLGTVVDAFGKPVAIWQNKPWVVAEQPEPTKVHTV